MHKVVLMKFIHQWYKEYCNNEHSTTIPHTINAKIVSVGPLHIRDFHNGTIRELIVQDQFSGGNSEKLKLVLQEYWNYYLAFIEVGNDIRISNFYIQPIPSNWMPEVETQRSQQVMAPLLNTQITEEISSGYLCKYFILPSRYSEVTVSQVNDRGDTVKITVTPENFEQPLIKTTSKPLS